MEAMQAMLQEGDAAALVALALRDRPWRCAAENPEALFHRTFSPQLLQGETPPLRALRYGLARALLAHMAPDHHLYVPALINASALAFANHDLAGALAYAREATDRAEAQGHSRTWAAAFNLLQIGMHLRDHGACQRSHQLLSPLVSTGVILDATLRAKIAVRLAEAAEMGDNRFVARGFIAMAERILGEADWDASLGQGALPDAAERLAVSAHLLATAVRLGRVDGLADKLSELRRRVDQTLHLSPTAAFELCLCLAEASLASGDGAADRFAGQGAVLLQRTMDACPDCVSRLHLLLRRLSDLHSGHGAIQPAAMFAPESWLERLSGAQGLAPRPDTGLAMAH